MAEAGAYSLSEAEIQQAREIGEALESRSIHPTARRVRRLRVGKLDPRSAMRAERNPDDVRLFRGPERNPSGPSALDLVVNFDDSLSTLFLFNRIRSATAILVEAFEATGHPVSVVVFREDARVVKSAGARGLPARWERAGFGTTDLEAALRLDETLLSGSGAKIVVTLTDGDLGDGAFARAWFRRFRDDGGRSLRIDYREGGEPLGEDSVVRIGRKSDIELAPAVVGFLETIEEVPP